jgi:hypothetical protein
MFKSLKFKAEKIDVSLSPFSPTVFRGNTCGCLWLNHES